MGSFKKMKFLAGIIALASGDSSVKIIGGSVPNAGSEPYIVSLQRLGSHFCGGSIISSTRVVTAAHCRYASGVTAVGGAHNIKNNESTQQKKSVTSFVNHPSYNSNTQLNDIAVLKVQAFSLNSRVAKINMPPAKTGEWMPSGANIRVCGWGNTRYPGSSYPDELHCVNVNYVTQRTCNGRSSYDGAILTGMYCAGVSGGGKDACQGDSGGPSTYNNQLVGATSWGYGCALADYPGVYSDVAVYRNWINGI